MSGKNSPQQILVRDSGGSNIGCSGSNVVHNKEQCPPHKWRNSEKGTCRKCGIRAKICGKCKKVVYCSHCNNQMTLQ